jgi:hypothetical protein
LATDVQAPVRVPPDERHQEVGGSGEQHLPNPGDDQEGRDRSP